MSVFGVSVLLMTAAAVISWLLLRALLRSLGARVLDVPNERSLHALPVPRGGGAAIVLVVLVGVAAASCLGKGGLSGGFWGAALTLALVGAYDDVKGLGAGIRLAFQVGAALVVLGTHFPGSTTVVLPGAVPVTLPAAVVVAMGIFWLVGMTNVYNFMDGADGMAGVQGSAAAVGWAIVGRWLGHEGISLIGLLIAGALLGFLAYNWAPARVFLGDVGSAFLGFVFAALVFVAGQKLGGRIPLAALLFVWPFGFDAAYTLVRRARRAENLFRAHRSHLYQRMVLAGWSHAGVAKLYGLLAAFCTLSGLAWLFLPEPFASGLSLLAFVGAPAVLLERVSSLETRRRSGIQGS